MPAKTDQRLEWPRSNPLLTLDLADIARLPGHRREARVRALMGESLRIYQGALETLVYGQGKRLAATAVLFSGGNDSTVLAHLARPYVDLAVHANTTIGIEETREFVRKTCADWGLRLDERLPPTTYRELVLEQGFPGPGQHYKMFQRLKERAILAARADLVDNPRADRVVYLAGRRRDESARRAEVPLWEREGSLVWVSPLAFWTALDLNTYRLMFDVPINEVTRLVHMSGECLCGAFAKRGELDEIGAWFPAVAAEIRALEAEVFAARAGDEEDGGLSPERCRWGWGADRDRRQHKVGAMCSSCAVSD